MTDYMSTAEAARLLQVTTWTVSSWAKEGQLGDSVPPPVHPVTGLINRRAGWQIDADAVRFIRDHGFPSKDVEKSGPPAADSGNPDSSIRSEDDPNRGGADASTGTVAPEVTA